MRMQEGEREALLKAATGQEAAAAADLLEHWAQRGKIPRYDSLIDALRKQGKQPSLKGHN